MIDAYQHSSHRIASSPVQCVVNNRLEKTAVFLPVTPGHLKKISQPRTFGNLPSQKAPKDKTTGPTVHHLPRNHATHLFFEYPSNAKKIPVWVVRLGSRTLNSKKEFKKYFSSGLANT